MMPPRVIVEDERMKYPYTGLFTFCEQLSKSLVKNQHQTQAELSFYVPENQVGFLGVNQKYHLQKSWHKLYNPIHAKADLWHGTYQGSRYFPRSGKLKKMLTIHDLNFLVEQRKSEQKQKKLLQKVQAQVDEADQITVISNFTLQFIKQHLNLKGKNVEVIYNGCDVNLMANPPQKPEFITDGHPFFFSIGTIAEKKNFHVLVPLLRDNECKLIIAGIHQQPDYVEKIKSEAKKHDVLDRVILPGSITTAEKWWLMQQCSAFLFPSIAEGFGIPVVEAMHFERPIILSSHTCLPEIGGNAAYYFADFDPDLMMRNLQDAVNDFSSNPNKKQAMAERSKMFNWDLAAEKYIDLYNKILEL